MQISRKQYARRLFTQVMQSVSVPQAMQRAFVLEDHVLGIGPERLDLCLFRRSMLMAIGKAATPMAEHALTTLRDALPTTGIAVGPSAWSAPVGLKYLQGDHPVPSENSFVAAQELLRFAEQADETTLVLYLISGGASALAEAPLDPSIRYEEIAAFYEHLLHAGLPIGKVNALRKHFSAIKGGRLALASGAATRCTLLISDVPSGKLDVVGSGPSLADPSTVTECLELLAETERLKPLSESMRRFATNMPETPKHLPEGRLPAISVSLLSSDSLIDAARPFLSADGYRVVVDNTCDDWDYHDAAAYLVGRAVQESAMHVPVCILSAGEVTVSIHGKAGVGGRNQQWSLDVARLLRDIPGWVAMSVGSDGIDGNSPAAGAVVDGLTWKRAEQAGIDPQLALNAFDSFPLFSALQDAIVPGASGNNIRDLRAILVHRTLHPHDDASFRCISKPVLCSESRLKRDPE